MPYDVEKTKEGYKVIKKDTGEVVARPKDMKGVKGYIWHATKNETDDLLDRIGTLHLPEQRDEEKPDGTEDGPDVDMKKKKEKGKATKATASSHGAEPRIEGPASRSVAGIAPMVGGY